MHEQQAADHRRHRRRDAEEDRHLRHHALRVRRREHVADDGARDHHAGAGRHALQRAVEDQLADGVRQRAAHRGQREQRHAAQHQRPPAQAVGQRAVEQVHDREAEQVARQRLLHLHRRRAHRGGDAGEGRQVGVDREGPEHAQAGEQQGQRPARAAPERVGVGVHRLGETLQSSGPAAAVLQCGHAHATPPLPRHRHAGRGHAGAAGAGLVAPHPGADDRRPVLPGARLARALGRLGRRPHARAARRPGARWRAASTWAWRRWWPTRRAA